MKSLKILYGNNLKEKDSLIFSQIRNIIDGGGKVLYIVPEQYAFSADKSVLFMLGEKYSHLTETINFRRMALLVNEQFCPQKKNFVTEEIKNLILYKIYCDNVSKFKTLSKRGKSPDSVLIFKDILTELKANLITEEELTRVIDSLPDNTYLKNKLCDLRLIESEYEKYISENYREFEDGFSNLSKNIEEHNLYKDYYVFLDSFVHFSKGELGVIASLMKNIKSLNVVLLGEDFKNQQEGDLFYLTSHTAQSVLKLAEDMDYKVSYEKADKEGFDLTPIFDGKTCENKNIIMTDCHTRTDEIRDVVLKIKHLIKSGASYSDIAVFAGDMSVYEDIIPMKFNSADIPFFDDRKKSLCENPICRLLISAFSFYMSGLKVSEMITYLKNLVFLYGNFDEICLFEKTVSSFRIEKDIIKNQEKWETALDTALLGNKYLKARKADISKVYKKFILPVIDAFSDINKKNKAEDYKNAFSKLIKGLNLEKALLLYNDKAADREFVSELSNAYNTFIGAIKNICLINKDEILLNEDYFALLKQSAQVYQTGSLPNLIDCVTVSDLERGRSESKKYVFILGFNEGVSPKTNENTGFLSDKDRKLIENITNTKLPTALWKNNSSLLSLYRACSLYEETLYISKSSYTDNGEELTQSYMWGFFNQGREINISDLAYTDQKEAVVKAISKSDKQSDFYKSISQKYSDLFSDIDKMHSDGYFSLDKKVSKKVIDSKFNRKLRTSVSKIETYRKCGYSYFLKYLLRVDEGENASYDFAKTGTLIHDIVDIFSKKMADDKMEWENVNEEYIDAIVKNAVYYEINEKFPKLSMFNPRTKHLMSKLSRTAKTAILYIKEHFIKGEFMPLGYEIPIGDDGNSPISLALSDGAVVEIHGRIDRADGFKDGDKLHIRIIDYKSSAKEIDFTLVKEGIQIQLLTYLRALIKNGNEFFDFAGEILPGAALYMNVGDKIERLEAEDELYLSLKKKFTLDGIILNDDAVISAMDREFKNNPTYTSDIINISSKNGGFKINNLLYREQFDVLLADCENLIKKTGEKILNGEYYVRPYRMGDKTACEWCAYKGICNFDSSINAFHKLEKITKDTYFEKGDTQNEEQH